MIQKSKIDLRRAPTNEELLTKERDEARSDALELACKLRFARQALRFARQVRDKNRDQRDEARRTVCRLFAVAPITPREQAIHVGWDCYLRFDK